MGLRRRSGAGGPKKVPWAIAIPGVLFLLAFSFVAPLSSAWYAFTDWNGISAAHWVGFHNFSDIFSSPATRKGLVNTILIAGCLLVASNVIGLVLALGLNRTIKSRNFLRALFFLPAVVSPLASAYVWQYIFTFDGGLNRALGWLGLDSWERPWLGDPTWAIWTVIIVLIWQFVGLAMVIYLAGLQGIPQELDEATAVDGASTWLRFRKVTLPLLAPSITIAATLSMIHGLRVFDQVMALTGGGPVGATDTLATQVYQQTFTYGHFGYGAALSLVLTVLVAVLSLGQLLFLRSREARL